MPVPDYYADSSVLVKRHVQETGSAWFRALCTQNSGNLIITTRLSIAEVYSALNRRRREADISTVDYQDLVGDFETVCTSEYQITEVTQAVIKRARFLLEQHPLRAYDAIQLASALLAQTALQTADLPPLRFLAADERLIQAAQAESLPTDNPNLYA